MTSTAEIWLWESCMGEAYRLTDGCLHEGEHEWFSNGIDGGAYCGRCKESRSRAEILRNCALRGMKYYRAAL